MDGDRTEIALSRIDAALARLEAAASGLKGTDDGLSARHETLRSAVAQALNQLDTLIAGQQR